MGLRFDELRIDYAGLPDLQEFPARDGASLPVRHYPSASERHLVLLHGSGYHGRYLFPLARDVAERGAAHVHTPALRGHGLAPARRGDIDYTDQLEDDVADLIAHVRRKHPGASVVLGGHSSGGGLALRVAGGPCGGGIEALLLLAPYLRHDAPTTRPGSGGWALPKLGRIVALSILNQLGVHALDGTVSIEFHMPEEYRDGSETLAYSHRLNTGFAPRDYAAELRALRIPLLVLVGSEDEAFVPERYEPTIHQYAPDAEVGVVPNASHMGAVVAEESRRRVIAWIAGR